jgi:hypothetical protein
MTDALDEMIQSGHPDPEQGVGMLSAHYLRACGFRPRS